MAFGAAGAAAFFIAFFIAFMAAMVPRVLKASCRMQSELLEPTSKRYDTNKTHTKNKQIMHANMLNPRRSSIYFVVGLNNRRPDAHPKTLVVPA